MKKMSRKSRFAQITFILASFLSSINLLEVRAFCLISSNGIKILETNTNYWSKEIEDVVIKDYQRESPDLKLNLSGQHLIGVHHGCGRMLNRMGVLSNGVKICIRYRENMEQIQGEFVSSMFGKLLGLENIIDVHLMLINSNDELWKEVKISEQYWENGKLVTATKYMADSRPVYVPDLLLQNDFILTRNSSLCGLDNSVIKKLIQWTDLVLFDYLIGNFDRFVSNMFNLQWYSRSLVEPIENIFQRKDGFWVLIDNEEGFSHGYRLLEKYEPFLKKLLKSTCIFRRQTVMKIRKLAKLSTKEIRDLIWLETKRNILSTKLLDAFPGLSEHNLSILKRRIGLVNDHISFCEEQGSRRKFLNE